MARNDFADYCTELLLPLGQVRTKRMFGGHGLYVDDVFVGFVSTERLYFKADDITRARFEEAGCMPFEFESRGKTMTTSFYTVPDDAMESPAAMQPWARLALEAALRARAAKKTPVKPRSAARKASSSAAKPRARR